MYVRQAPFPGTQLRVLTHHEHSTCMWEIREAPVVIFTSFLY